MKILHIIQSLDPAAGGPPVVAACLAAGQSQLGNRVTILAGVVPADTTKLGDLDGVTVSPAPNVSLCNALLASRSAAELSPLISEHDVLHLHGVWDPLLYAAAKLARKAGRPYMVAPHGMLDPWSLTQKRWKKRLALALGWRSMLNHAASLHLLNSDEQKLLGSLGLTVPGVLIPNGVDLELFSKLPGPDLFRNSMPALGDRPYVLFLSRIHYKKGLDYLVDAFQIISERGLSVDLVVAGPDDGARPDLEQRVAAAGLSQRVHVPGPIYGREKLSALAGAACFCLPSRQEGFSVAILEALACGTPVVVSENCHFPEVAEVGAGEVVPLETAAVAAALQRVLTDSALAQRMGAAGRALVAERFTWPRICQRSVNVYAGFTAIESQRSSA